MFKIIKDWFNGKDKSDVNQADKVSSHDEQQVGNIEYEKIDVPAHIDTDTSAVVIEFPNNQQNDLTQNSAFTPIARPKSPLAEYLSSGFFGLGVHNGTYYQTVEDLDRGKMLIISKAINIAQQMIEENEVKLSKIRTEMIQIDGLSERMVDQLKHAHSEIERRNIKLDEHIANANVRKGVVLAAINEYEMGFQKGAKEYLDIGKWLN